MIKCVIFDFFGVVCPNLNALTGAEFSQRHGIDPIAFSQFGSVHRNSLDRGRMSQRQFAVALCEKFGITTDIKHVMAELDALDGDYYAFNHKLYNLIVQLKPQTRVALMSNVARDEGDYLRGLGAYEVFDEVFLSSDAGLTKPDPRWFGLVSDKLNLEPSQLMLIDDMPTNVDGARRAGWIESVVYTDATTLNKQLRQLGFTLEPEEEL